ncbi:yeats family-domain-containing protein [Cokeromyces recurvatus]|uniref:yeats family-domain-containing protein n=1 Tax=Cokeromyces recurvatus TaxID=90255 RepID=UPI002220CD0A|nr:yeats family-domain-containing protein [Cokeromyces recurvatus]KAI7908048.1 yeats family-domain-containing protein [Cokeromyces recurvatus]
MTLTTQDIKISCHNSIIKGPGAKSNDGHPWRNWKITLVAMDGEEEVKGKLSIILDHVEYILHPTFKDPIRAKEEEPYLLQEKGWGEFDMRIVLYFADHITDPQVLLFDLNFAMSNYSVIHTIEFPNASPELIKLLSINSSTVKAMLAAQASAKASSTALAAETAITASPSPRKGSKRPRLSSPTPSNNSGKIKDEGSNKQSLKHNRNDVNHQETKSNRKLKPEKTFKRKTERPSSRRSSISSTSSQKPSLTEIRSPAFSPHLSSPSYTVKTPPSHHSPLSPHIDLNYIPPTQNEEANITTPLSPRIFSDEEGELVETNSSSIHEMDEQVEYVNNLEDVYNLRPIHYADIGDDLREEWDIPNINIAEFARRMFMLNPEQLQEFQKIILRDLSDTMTIFPEEDGSIGIDLYSLGKPLLEKLWEFLDDVVSDDNESFTSQDFHTSDLEFGSDVDLNEYDSEELQEDETISPLEEYNDDHYEPYENNNDEGYYEVNEEHQQEISNNDE